MQIFFIGFTDIKPQKKITSFSISSISMFLFQMRTTSNTLHAPLSFHRFSLTESILTQEATEIETNSHAIVVLAFCYSSSPKVVFYLKKPPASFFLPRVRRKSRCTDQMHF